MGLAIGLFLKSMFSGILNIFKLIISDWRILALIGVVCVSLYGWWKWDGVQKDLAEQRAKVESIQEANDILLNNNKILADANKQNELVIEQVKKDSSTTKAQVDKLNNDLNLSAKKISDLKIQLENSSIPPTPLSPHIASVINAIQKMGEQK